jgi:hypothetical protein
MGVRILVKLIGSVGTKVALRRRYEVCRFGRLENLIWLC